MSNSLAELADLHDELVFFECRGCVDEGVCRHSPCTTKDQLGCALWQVPVLGKILITIGEHRAAAVIVLVCIGLYCIVLFCIGLYCIGLYCIGLYCFGFYCIGLY